MKIKYLNIIIDKETFIKEHYEKLMKESNLRRTPIKEFETRLKRLESNFNTTKWLPIFGIGIIVFSILFTGVFTVLDVLGILYMLFILWSNHNVIVKLKQELAAERMHGFVDDLCKENFEYSLQLLSFEDWIKNMTGPNMSDGPFQFLYLYYATEITSVEKEGSDVRIQYIEDGIEKVQYIRDVQEKGLDSYDSLSLVNHNLIFGNNGNTVAHAVDSKIIEGIEYDEI